MSTNSTVQVVHGENQVTIRIRGHFGFALYREIRAAYQQGGPAKRYVVDLAEAEHIDSSALGMLLLLREHTGNERDRVVLARPIPVVRKILEIASFDRLFQIV